MGESIFHLENGPNDTKTRSKVGKHVPRMNGNLPELFFIHFSRRRNPFSGGASSFCTFLYQQGFLSVRTFIFLAYCISRITHPQHSPGVQWGLDFERLSTTVLFHHIIANSIFDYIKFTVDCPSNHPSGWMPLLGSQVRVAEDNTIDYLFFEKEIACKFVMMRDSAMSTRVKMNTLTQEVIRRLRNTRASLDWNEFKVPILTEFCKKMARSGYPQEYRSVVIKSGVIGFERQLAASQRGERPLFRPREWQKEERRKRKMIRKAAWYRPADVVGFFPPSPRGELVANINKVLEEEGRRIGIKMKAIETGGLSLAKQLVRPDLKRGEPCGRPGCVLDRTSGGAGGPHNIPSSLYRGGCRLCEAEGESAEYWGESGFSGSHRCDGHDGDVTARRESNAFAKHLALFHPDHQGDITNFDIQVKGLFQKPLTRQKTEAIKIQSSQATRKMNSKAEHRQPALLRVTLIRENAEPGIPRQQAEQRRRGS